MFREYTKTMQMLHRFPHAYNAVQTREMKKDWSRSLTKLGRRNYHCTATDGWQIWFRPTPSLPTNQHNEED